MTDPIPINAYVASLQAGEALQAKATEQLLGGGGGGTSGGMEERLTRVEVRMDHAIDALKGLKGEVGELRKDVAVVNDNVTKALVDTATLKERVASKGYVFGIVMGGFAFFAAAIAFADQIRKLITG